MSEQREPSLQNLYELFILDGKARRFSVRTIGTYDDRLKPFVKWSEKEGVASIQGITSNLIKRYLVLLQERKLADHTIHGIARSIKTFLNFCVREGLITDSPMKRVKMPRMDKKILPAFSVADVQALLNVCDSARDEAVILFLLDTGLRASELVNLVGSDIDVQTGNVLVRLGKGRKDRTVYLGAKALRQLLRYYMKRGTPGANDSIWLSEKGGAPLSDSGLRQILKRLGKAANIKHCSPHTFRRTFALWTLRAGMSLYHLQRLMGHADLQVLRQYLALTDADLKEAHKQAGAVDTMLNERKRK